MYLLPLYWSPCIWDVNNRLLEYFCAEVLIFLYFIFKKISQEVRVCGSV